MEREWVRSGGKARARSGARGVSGWKAEPWAGGRSGNGAGSGKSRIPERWQEYSAVGQRLPGTRFIAFKVPLKKVFESRLMPHEIFSPTDLLNQISEQHQELGKIIDLTFTKRYYDSTELPEDLHYEKIFTAGHEVPSAKNILSFKQAVKTFLLENMDNDKLVGVHCTHGVNRTGYLICRYLIDVDGMDPREAIDLFNKSRGHPIERQNYIQDLLQGPQRSNKGIDVVTKQMGQFNMHPMFAPQDRAKQAKYPARNDRREFSHFACPPEQFANSYLPTGRFGGNSALHQPVLSNGQCGASSDHTGRWQQSSWRNYRAHSPWQQCQVESPWGRDQPLHPWAGYQRRAARSTRGKKLISQDRVRGNTHLRWDD
ncbi:RNA/RNP complex-1-interacting phosphatase-like [Mobula hypostoma]|uniref:RNA/RNP complex-1-interacting phosphatase-like n=1 Tax=Mobula hypostoma TaxID=723540 RepID=UPI002FC2F063